MRIEVIETTDAGNVTRVDCKLVKPKLLRARFPKLPVPPLGICLYISTHYCGENQVAYLCQNRNCSKEVRLGVS